MAQEEKETKRKIKGDIHFGNLKLKICYTKCNDIYLYTFRNQKNLKK